MQPRQDDDTWQQPSEQPSKAPYAVPSDTPKSTPPVVTMTSDIPPEASPSAPQPTSEASQPPAVSMQPSGSDPKNDKVPAESNDDPPVRWQAHEYIHHEKGVMWFVVFAIVVLVLMALAIFVLDALSFAILLPVMAAALLVYTHRPPRILDYTLSRQGLHVNDHLYSFTEFKGFGVVRDGEEYSVMLIPTKRFRPGVFVYFPEDAGEAIVDMLGARLPMLELHLDVVDRIVRKLRI